MPIIDGTEKTVLRRGGPTTPLFRGTVGRYALGVLVVAMVCAVCGGMLSLAVPPAAGAGDWVPEAAAGALLGIVLAVLFFVPSFLLVQGITRNKAAAIAVPPLISAGAAALLLPGRLHGFAAGPELGHALWILVPIVALLGLLFCRIVSSGGTHALSERDLVRSAAGSAGRAAAEIGREAADAGSRVGGWLRRVRRAGDAARSSRPVSGRPVRSPSSLLAAWILLLGAEALLTAFVPYRSLDGVGDLVLAFIALLRPGFAVGGAVVVAVGLLLLISSRAKPAPPAGARGRKALLGWCFSSALVEFPAGLFAVFLASNLPSPWGDRIGSVLWIVLLPGLMAPVPSVALQILLNVAIWTGVLFLLSVRHFAPRNLR